MLAETDVLSRIGGADYSRVVARVDYERLSAFVVDTNDDGKFVVFGAFHKNDDTVWREVVWENASVFTSHLIHGYICGQGVAAPASVVLLSYAGVRFEVTSGSTGWWLFVTEALPGEDRLHLV